MHIGASLTIQLLRILSMTFQHQYQRCECLMKLFCECIYNSSYIAGVNVDPLELKLPYFTPDELLSRTFLHKVDGRRMRARVVWKIIDNDAHNHQNIKCLIEIGAGEFYEIIAQLQ